MEMLVMKMSSPLVLGIALVALLSADRMNAQASVAGRAEQAMVDRLTASWPERPRLGAREMMAKYGMPQEATAERLIWHNVGPYKRVSVLKLETPHDFPLPHVDYLEHTISYNVPQDKVGALVEFDASSTINRTVGELSARCDLEGHNILTLNLDHDIVMGKKSVAEARKAFGDIVVQDVMGKHPAYVEALQFQPTTAMAAAFSDSPVIPGSPQRAADMDAAAQQAMDRARLAAAEMLATVAAIDLNEIGAAAQATAKHVRQPVRDYARSLHEEHGMNMDATLKLGQQMGITPVITPAVEQLQKKGAGELAMFVRLDGDAFEREYLMAMVKGHTEALAKLDQMQRSAADASLKAHLTATRANVAQHLQMAKSLQSDTRRSASR